MKCVCTHGQAATGEECTKNDSLAEVCRSCSDGYHLWGKRCRWDWETNCQKWLNKRMSAQKPQYVPSKSLETKCRQWLNTLFGDFGEELASQLIPELPVSPDE